jgi:hypothetical protein
MALKHNKKRNVGLMYEFLARYLAKSILENNDSNIKKAKEIAKKHFNGTNNISKELKLFNTLYEANYPNNRNVAIVLIEKVKSSILNVPQKEIDEEKHLFLKDVSSLLMCENFFNSEVKNYKTYATIQVLLNHWRSKELFESLSEEAELQEKLIEHITTPAIDDSSKKMNEIANSDVNGLVVKIMAEKINKKFSSVLCEEQRKIIQSYATNDYSTLNSLLESTKIQSLKLINEAFLQKESYQEDVMEKLNKTKNTLLEKYSVVSDKPSQEQISFYLGLVKLNKELLGE